MSVGNTYGIDVLGGVQNNQYITNPQVEHNRVLIPKHTSLEKTPIKDTFNPKNTPITIPYKEKIVSNIQDRILARFAPEKLVEKYTNEEFLAKAIKNNPRIAEMLAKQGLEVKIEPQNVRDIIKSHLIPTMFYAKKIMAQSGQYFSSNDYEAMCQAAVLHDIGKALIPSEILNKKGKLTPEERQIIELHNDLGYEILKSTALSPKVLAMVKNHHDYQKNRAKDSLTQILTVADIYSALKEKRAYKNIMSDKEAFEILEQKAQEGEYDKTFVSILKTARNYSDNENKTKDLIAV